MFKKYEGGISPETKQAFLKEDDGKKVQLLFSPENVLFLEMVRNQPSRVYDAKNRCWYMPLNRLTFEFLKRHNVEISPKITKNLKEREKITPLNPDLMIKPRDYQKYGMGFIDKSEGRCLIGDEAGLGKTLQAIGYFFHKKIYPVLILCPASLKINWQREVYNTTGKTAQVIYGSPSLKQRLGADIVIINYDIIDRWENLIEKYNFKLMILDESQKLKNSSTKRTKGVLSLSNKIQQVIALSATALENSPMDLFTTFRILDRELFTNKHIFGLHYTNAKQGKYGWVYGGSRNTKELYTLLGHLMLRRKKEEVLTELPPLQKVVIPFKLSNYREYTAAQKEFVNNADLSKKLSTMAKTETLKQLINAGKQKEIVEWIETYLESGDKLIVFAIHITVVEQIHKAFSKIAVKLYGQQTKKKNQEAIDQFQEGDKVKLLVANIDSGGVGLTLTAAPSVAFVELPWNPALLYQAENRIHRIGQKADKLTSYYLIAQDTMEEKILGILDEKTDIRNQILDGKNIKEHDILTLLLQRMKDK